MTVPNHCEKHEFAIEQQGRQIEDIYDKFESISTLPGKVDTQTEILKKLAADMNALADHKAQLAVICEVLSDYKNHKIDDLEFRKKCNASQNILNKIDTDQIQRDHDLVTKMDTEWNMVKYFGPIIAAIVGGILGKVADKLWP